MTARKKEHHTGRIHLSRADIAGIFLLGLVYLVLALTGIGCPLRFLTGISCAGCGMSRALLSAVCGRFQAAFAYHPLFPLVPLTILLYILRQHFPLFLQRLYLGAVIFLFIAVYVIRMINHDPALMFAPQKGFIFICIKTLFSLF